ncbi:MAG: hypothetical protein PQJ58_09105 [Spirochaetales bacterium]|nr:hypothetical protein [Spirochaetales bacterium]
MRFIHFLKAGSKRNRLLQFPAAALFLFIPLLLPAESRGEGRYSFSEKGNLVLSYSPRSVSEQKIRQNISQGHKSEIYISYRIQQNSGRLEMGGVHHEINIRRTGFQDLITGDYVLMLDGRESAVFQDWDSFYGAFTSTVVYPSRLVPDSRDTLQVKIKSRIIYKKLVPPFSMLYLIPGKFMHSEVWQVVHPEEFR